MNLSTDLSPDGFLGFFELDDAGTVRFSSCIANAIGTGSRETIIGQNFFESAAFRNSDELRRHFRRFIESREAADTFTFDCCLGTSVIHTKVTFTRAFQTEFFPPESIVMLSIKESSK